MPVPFPPQPHTGHDTEHEGLLERNARSAQLDGVAKLLRARLEPHHENHAPIPLPIGEGHYDVYMFKGRSPKKTEIWTDTITIVNFGQHAGTVKAAIGEQQVVFDDVLLLHSILEEGVIVTHVIDGPNNRCFVFSAVPQQGQTPVQQSDALLKYVLAQQEELRVLTCGKCSPLSKEEVVRAQSSILEKLEREVNKMRQPPTPASPAGPPGPSA